MARASQASVEASPSVGLGARVSHDSWFWPLGASGGLPRSQKPRDIDTLAQQKRVGAPTQCGFLMSGDGALATLSWPRAHIPQR